MKKKLKYVILISITILCLGMCIVLFHPQAGTEKLTQMNESFAYVNGPYKMKYGIDTEEEWPEPIDKIIDAGTLASQIILSTLLFVIPMIVIILLFAFRKDKKGTGWLYAQKILSYTISFFSLFSLMFFKQSEIALILLFVSFGILTLLTILEMAFRKSRDFVLLFFETIAWVETIYFLITSETFLNIELGLWTFNSIIFIWIIVRMCVINKKESSQYLPFSVTSMWELWIRYLYLTVFFSIAFIFTIGNTGYFLLSIFLVFIGFILLQYLKGIFWTARPLRKYWKTLNIIQFEEDILNIQKRPNLHPDTILYYNILFMSCVILHDKEKFYEYFKKCEEPKTKGLKAAYRGLILRYGMSREEFENAFEILKKEFYNNRRIVKRFDKFYQYWLPYYGTNSNYANIKLYKTNRKHKEYQNAISLFILVYYYKNFGQIDKAQELKSQFLKKYSVLTECVKDLEAV